MGIVLASNFDVNAALPLDSRDVVADTTARDAIVSGRRFLGMVVYSVADQAFYTLKTGITNGDWEDFGTGGGGVPTVSAGLTAHAGGGQGAALALPSEINQVSTVATAADSVKLPAATAGLTIIVFNDGANSMNVFPQSGEAIDAGAANAAYAFAPSLKRINFTCVVAGSWKTNPSVASSTVAGVVSTAAQTFAGAKTFSNPVAVADTLSLGVPLIRASGTGITAFAGGGQGSAFGLAYEFNQITTCATAGDSVILQNGVPGVQMVVFNDGAASCDVFPFSGQQIDDLGVDVAFAVAAGTNVTFFCVDTGIWKSLSAGSSLGTPGAGLGLRYSCTTSPTVTTDGVLKFDTKDFDTDNAYDGTTGIFTAPVSSVYNVSVMLTAGSGVGNAGNLIVRAKVNGTDQLIQLIGGTNHVDTTSSITFTGLVRMNANETLEIWASSTTGAALAAGGGLQTLSISGWIPASGTPREVTVTKLISGSGTYTTPANCSSLVVTMAGAGGGGGGSYDGATSPGAQGGTGTDTTFGTSLLTAGGGVGGQPGGSGLNGGAGGAATIVGTDGIGFPGGSGTGYGSGAGANTAGGAGASSAVGGGGGGGTAGLAGKAAATNSGSGGGGGGAPTSGQSGTGGGAGASISAFIQSPLGTYTFSVGVGGIAGTAGTAGFAGGAGADGFILIEERYNFPVGSGSGGVSTTYVGAMVAYGL